MGPLTREAAKPLVSGKRLSLAQKTYHALKDDILTCELAPGQMVTEADLAERYQVSKTPIREALNLLSQEGYILALPRRGTLVRPIELKDIQQTYVLRELLEPHAAALAAENATPSQLDELRDLLGSVGSGDGHGSSHGVLRREQLRAHGRFHEAIGEATGMSRLAHMIRSLHEEVERLMNANAQIGRSLNFGHMDSLLLEAIIDRKPEEARNIAAESVEVSRQTLIQVALGRG